MKGMRGVCHYHKNCVCWLSVTAVSKPMANPMLDLVDWASRGGTLSEDEHYRDGQNLKREYGMKVR